MEFTLLGALAAGFFGSTHCLGMCSGIAASLGMQTSGTRRSVLLVLYQFGRVSSYAIAGAFAGGAGAMLAGALLPRAVRVLPSVLLGLIMVAIGFTLLTNWGGLRRIEAMGLPLWKRIEPIARRLIPAERPSQALALGFLWGWLPCGLVYTLLTAAAASADMTLGAAIMVSFGIGTMPAMFGASVAAQGIRRFMNRPRLRQAAGALVIGFGLLTAAIPLLGLHGGHGGHAEHMHASHGPASQSPCRYQPHVSAPPLKGPTIRRVIQPP